MADKYDMSLLSDLFGKEMLRQSILASAQEEVTEIMAQANALAASASEEAKAKAAELKRQIVAAAVRAADQEKTVILSSAEMRAQKLALAHKDELVSQVISQVKARIEETKKASLTRYSAVLKKLAGEGLTQLAGKEFVLCVNEKDRVFMGSALVDELKSKYQLTALTVSPRPAPILGGVIVEADGGRIVYDNSFDNILERKKPELRYLVSRILLEGDTVKH